MPVDNSPYYIRTTNSLPEALPTKGAPWLARLRAWTAGIQPNFTAKERASYEGERNTGQIVADGSNTYATKLQAEWSRGTRSNDVMASTVTPRGWFPWPIGGPTGRQDASGYQPAAPEGTPIGNARNQGPLPAPYQQFHSGSVPNIWGGSTPSEVAFNQGPAPWRVPMARKPGISLMAGDAQFSTQQYAAGMDTSVVIAPPAWSSPTRGARSVSGIFGRVQGNSRTRIPAVYVPRQVR